MHRAAASARADGPPTSESSKAAANAVKLLIEASTAKGGGASSLDAPSQSGTPFLAACSRGAEGTIAMLAEMGANAAATMRSGVGGAALATASGSPGALKARGKGFKPSLAPSHASHHQHV